MNTAESHFPPRASLSGTIRLLCPDCGYVALYRLDRTQWRIQCKHRSCRHLFSYGLILYSMPRNPGGPVLPPEDVTFPRAILESYPRGERPRVHRVVSD